MLKYKFRKLQIAFGGFVIGLLVLVAKDQYIDLIIKLSEIIK